MKFITEDENDIRWMHNPEQFENIADTVKRIKDAGKWEEFLQMHQDDATGVVDCDDLYEYLRYESGDALQDVGLHDNEATATVEDVLKAWEEENAADGLKVSRLDDGTPSGLMLFDYGHGSRYIVGGISLDFESVDEDGAVEEVSLDADEVYDLLKYRITCANNATCGQWTGTDCKTDIFEMWRGRD